MGPAFFYGDGMKKDEEYVTIARVAKTQGRRGEVGCVVYTDFPDKFAERKRVFLWDSKVASSERRTMKVEEHWFHKGMVVLKFEGVESITEAEALIGNEVQIPEPERGELEAGAYYISDLAGCRLLDRGVEIGEITDVNTANGAAPLLVVRRGEVEFEVPFAESYLESVDLAVRQVRMNLPEGLLGINE
ncbi:MAG: ribosome maturation factor RimM [Acidobacteriaceae bacterium]